jgi:hypothetical protein
MDTTKAANLIASGDDDGLLDLKTALAAKPAAKLIAAPPPYKRQDLDINGRDGLDGLNRLKELQGLRLDGLDGVVGLTSSTAQWAQQACRLDGLPA